MLFNVLAVLVTLAVTVSSVLLIRGLAATRRSGPGGPVHDLMEVAFLNGGPGRVADTALAAMASDGRLTVGWPGIATVQHPVANDPVERAVLLEAAAAPNGALHTLRVAVMRNPAVQEIGDGLAARGLMVVPRALRPWHIWAFTHTICCFLLLPVSIALSFVQFVAFDLDAGFPVPFIVKVLPAFFAGLVVGLVCMAKARGKVTAAGRRAAADYARAHAYAGDAGRVVALHGLRALLDGDLRGHLMAAARMARNRPVHAAHHGSGDTTAAAVVVWCASSDPGSGSGGSGGGGCGGASCGGGGGSSCGGGSGGGSSCGGGGGGSSCGGGSSS
ncbi:TIGR04222 domain-containing membrane protein [Streptomyces formicae]|uniref:TIGR04222 domain-containing membrane protein n=1 Tax=Streptomyces formicae TaxID=1616117 RepID=A0ABY3WKB2_9ACTN|nr:TIGR04222 domain-containing membrane protein [Streptomyces formicae]UNM11919.1 TIGR04222 domain-containing membrane protein [Streptomyces formicae]